MCRLGRAKNQASAPVRSLEASVPPCLEGRRHSVPIDPGLDPEIVGIAEELFGAETVDPFYSQTVDYEGRPVSFPYTQIHYD